MKKIVVIAALMLSTLGVSAQHAVGSLTLQPKIGLNMADLTKADGSDLRIGAVIGAELEYQMDDLVGISVGALYSMQGAKGSESIEGVMADETIKLDYINVPIMANFYVARNFAFKVGVQPGFNVLHKAKAEAGGVSAETDIPGITSFDLSIPLGLSYEFNNIVLDARYNIGMTKWMSELKSKHSVIQITLGYKFDL